MGSKCILSDMKTSIWWYTDLYAHLNSASLPDWTRGLPWPTDNSHRQNGWARSWK